jgi:hypothetical protein
MITQKKKAVVRGVFASKKVFSPLCRVGASAEALGVYRDAARFVHAPSDGYYS